MRNDFRFKIVKVNVFLQLKKLFSTQLIVRPQAETNKKYVSSFISKYVFFNFRILLISRIFFIFIFRLHCSKTKQKKFLLNSGNLG